MAKPICAKVSAAEAGQGYDLESSDERYHEAGYDAFLTGLCYLAMTSRLTALSSTASSKAFDPVKMTAPYLNKVCLRIPDVPYLNLAGDDLDPNRDHVFHLQFPPEWKFSDITQLFSAFGPVQISWLGDTSAYVALKEHPENAKLVIKTLSCAAPGVAGLVHQLNICPW